MNAQDNVLAAGLTAARVFSGRSITYTRGGTVLTVRALRGKYPIEQLRGELMMGAAELTDWIFPLADLIDGESGITPARGDYVTYDGLRFDVVSVPGLDCFNYVDPARTWIRVHTTRTA